MKKVTTNGRLYKELIPDIVSLLNEKNEIASQFKESDMGAYEIAMTQRVFGKQLCQIVAKEGQMEPQKAVKLIECTFECSSRIITTKNGKDKKQYTPKGWSAFSLVERLPSHKFGRYFSPKFLSSKVMRELENWGYVESHRKRGSVKMYRINGYKRDYLCSCQESHC